MIKTLVTRTQYKGTRIQKKTLVTSTQKYKDTRIQDKNTSNKDTIQGYKDT